jgi:PadR family transcriptional regulator PadR
MTDAPLAPPEWPGDWLRGVLSLCVLRVLADGPTYGYALGVRLARAGLGELKGGTLYPALTRLEQAGHVTVEWRAGEGGPGRKYYALTASGRAALDEGAARWGAFAALTADFVTDHHAAVAPAPIPGGPS